MSLDFFLIEIDFLVVVRSAFGSINSNDLIANQLSIFQKKDTEFEQLFKFRLILFSKVGYAIVVGYDCA